MWNIYMCLIAVHLRNNARVQGSTDDADTPPCLD